VRKPVLTIFYQYNPWQTSIGGIQTLISNFIKYAPDEFEVKLVGTGDEQTHRIGVWQEAELHGKKLQFFPLFSLIKDDVRRIIPTTVKYSVALFGRCFASDFMHFHRIEPTINTRQWKGDKTLFIHNDIRTQLLSKDTKQAILWKHFPKAYFALETALITQFNQILSCNHASTQFYQELYPSLSERFVNYRNSVDTDVFFPLSQADRDDRRQRFAKSLNLPETTRFVLFAGRLHPQKDPVLLVRAIAALNEPNVHLLLAGDGELADVVHSEIARLGLSKKITLLGAVKQNKLADLHCLSSLCVLTSAFEGLPLVVLEALACGTPIVTTRAGDTPNLLTENSGIVCEERSPSIIADTLKQVLQHPERYPSEACRLAAEPYSARKVIHELYRDMWQRWEQKVIASVTS
jgi:glycosyltransferase involved in cell wall biosynthesis